MIPRIEEISLHPGHGVAVRATLDADDLPRFFGAAFGELAQAVRSHGVQFAGPPFARYHTHPPAQLDVEAIMPVTQPVPALDGRVQPIELSGGRALQVRHVGPYETIAPVYEALSTWMKQHGVQPTEDPREVYLTDPSVVPDPQRWETLIIQPIGSVTVS